MAYNLLAIFSSVFLIFVTSKALKYKYSSFCISSMFIIIFASWALTVYRSGDMLERQFFENIIFTGNSARMLRAFILFLSAYFIFLIDKIKKNIVKDILYGIVAGVCIPCSNDYGVATFCALIILFILCKISYTKSLKANLISFCVFGFSAACTFFLILLIFTHGDILSWFEMVKGISSYQGWYFVGHKSCYIYEFNTSFWALVQIFFTLFLINKMIIHIKLQDSIDEILKYKVLALLNLGACIQTQELRFLGDGTFIISVGILLITLLMYNKNRIINLLSPCFIYKSKNYFVLIIIISAIFTSGSNLYSCFKKVNQQKIAEMGGKIKFFTDDLIEARNFIQDKKIFSTYASALEDITGQYQPSGYDYIIHVLGEKARDKYMKSFEERDFDFVTDINPVGEKPYNFSLWHFWLVNENWFFYKELYKNFHPVYANSYLIFYSPNVKPDYNFLPSSAKITCKFDNKNSAVISIETDENVNGIADVYLDFEIAKKSFFAKLFIFKKLLCIKANTLLNRSDKIYEIYISDKNIQNIPVIIANGKGYIEIESLPLHNVKLRINSVKADKYYTTPIKYFQIENINPNEKIVKIANNNFNLVFSQQAEKIKLVSANSVNDKIYDVVKIMYDEKYIYFYLLQKPNINKNCFIEVVKQKKYPD